LMMEPTYCVHTWMERLDVMRAMTGRRRA
jgi:hypothetical protein